MGIIAGVAAWCIVRGLVTGIHTVDQNERAVVTTFGRAERGMDVTDCGGSGFFATFHA